MLLALVIGPMAGALVAYLTGRKSKQLRNIVVNIITIAEVLLLAALGIQVLNGAVPEFSMSGICSMGISFRLDGFRLLYGMVAAFMWMMTTLFSPEYFAHYRNRNRYYFFLLMTLGATVGVFLSADLFTTFICFEIMSFTSYVWVAHDEHKESLRAAETYLAVAVIGGMVMLMGLFLLYHEVGTLDIESLKDAMTICKNPQMLYTAGALILFGFGAKAGMFPLHIWLPKAHPVAPAPASALLSGILTKSGIFGILAISCNVFLHDAKWGFVILILGVITMFGGALLAVFSINLKRTLACSSMSQIGFILVGIGMQCMLGEENALAVRGSVLHMVNHSMIKLVLFMAAGVVYFNLHKLDLNEIRGFGRKKPVLMLSFLVGALSISGVPLFSGYVSKTLLHESIVEYSHLVAGTNQYLMIKTIEWIFMITGGMTAAYMTKLFVAVFIEKNKDQQEMEVKDGHYMNPVTTFALAFPAFLLFLLGILPDLTMNPIATLAKDFMHGEIPKEAVHYFGLENLKGGAISLAIGAILYFGVIRTLLMKKQEDGTKIYVNLWPDWLDIENLIYRPVLQYMLPFLTALVLRVFDKMADVLITFFRYTVFAEAKEKEPIPYGNYVTHFVGSVMNAITAFMNVTFFRKHPVKKDYIKASAAGYAEFTLTTRLIAKSVSYGLLLFIIGLLVTVTYLLISM